MSILDEQGFEDLLRENVRISRDNNRLLRKLWRAQVMNFWSRIVFFAILIGVPVYIYRVYLDDYVIQVQDAYRQLRENVSGIVVPVEDASSAVLQSILE
jgi:hypothetical protein